MRLDLRVQSLYNMSSLHCGGPLKSICLGAINSAASPCTAPIQPLTSCDLQLYSFFSNVHFVSLLFVKSIQGIACTIRITVVKNRIVLMDIHNACEYNYTV